MKQLTFTLLAAAGLAFNANAVSFVANGNDLDIIFDTPLQITVTQASDTLSYGLNFEDVYTAPRAFVGSPGSGTALTLPSASSTSGGGLVGVNLGPSDPDDLYVFWSFPSTQPLAVGETVTVAAGTFTLQGFLGGGGGNLPDKSPSTAVLRNTSARVLSDPFSVASTGGSNSSVPDAGSSMALLALGLVGLPFCRRWVK